MLHYITVKILERAKKPERVLAFILFVLGTMSAFLINDTIALIATPMVIPFVAFYIKVIQTFNIDTKVWMALAGASTLAGNLTILGAASNVIILETAEKKRYTFSFIEFLKIGSIVTIVNIAILLFFLTIIP